MYKNVFILLIILILSCCINGGKLNYSDLMKKQLDNIPSELIVKLERQKVLIIGDPLFIDVVIIDEQNVSNVIISDKLIPNAEKRYFIAHLIRNILIHNTIIYNYDEQGNNFIMHPVVEVNDEFIYENKKVICDVIYYLLHKDYFNLYANPGTSGDKFFFSPILGNINEEIKQLKVKLINENGIIPIYMYIRD
jgi:hypothetical protein